MQSIPLQIEPGLCPGGLVMEIWLSGQRLDGRRTFIAERATAVAQAETLRIFIEGVAGEKIHVVFYDGDDGWLNSVEGGFVGSNGIRCT